MQLRSRREGYRVIQKKIAQDESGHIYVAEEYSCIKFALFTQYIYLHKSASFCCVYLTFGEVMQNQSQCSIFLINSLMYPFCISFQHWETNAVMLHEFN